MQNIVSPKPVADESDFIDKLVWFIWLGAIATIIYAYIFGTTTYEVRLFSCYCICMPNSF